MLKTDDKALFNKLRNIVDACMSAQAALYEDGMLSESFDQAMAKVQKHAAGVRDLRTELSRERLKREMRRAE